MGFSESIKLNVRKRAHFKCCMCQRPYVEIHHIVPEADDGEDTEENAAPLALTQRWSENRGLSAESYLKG